MESVSSTAPAELHPHPRHDSTTCRLRREQPSCAYSSAASSDDSSPSQRLTPTAITRQTPGSNHLARPFRIPDPRNCEQNEMAVVSHD